MTWQCSRTGAPATVNVPAAMVLAAVMVVLAKLMRLASSLHDCSVPGVAAASWGSAGSDDPPQPTSSATGKADSAVRA